MKDEKIPKWILANRGKVEKRIVGALKSSIDAHGDITLDNVSSAGKRMWGMLKGLIKEKRAENDDDDDGGTGEDDDAADTSS